MSKIRAIFRYLSAFILGVSLACGISPAVADITYQVATGIISGASAIVRINGTTDYLTFASPSNSYFNISFGDGGVTATQKMNISGSTPNGDNDSSLYLCAGGLNGGSDCSAAYGAAILMDGENTANKGDLQLSTGDASGSDLYLDMAATNSTVIFRDAGTNHQLWTYSVDGNITQNVTYGGDIIFTRTGTTLRIDSGTAASACAGTGTHNGTTAVTVSTTCAATGARIFTVDTSEPTTSSTCWVTNIVNGTSFDVDCKSAGQDATFAWWIQKEG